MCDHVTPPPKEKLLYQGKKLTCIQNIKGAQAPHKNYQHKIQYMTAEQQKKKITNEMRDNTNEMLYKRESKPSYTLDNASAIVLSLPRMCCTFMLYGCKARAHLSTLAFLNFTFSINTRGL